MAQRARPKLLRRARDSNSAEIRLVWWNLNGPNANRLRAQVQRLCALRPLPELLGLCEVPTERVGDLRDLVQPVGYEVFPAASDLEPKIKQVVIASRLPARPISTARFKVRADHPVREARGFDVWPKAVSSIEVSAGEQALSVHAVHIPNGSRNGWVKFDHLWALRDGLEHKQGPAIVCGDFNAPRLEVGSRIISNGQRRDGTWRSATSRPPYSPERPRDPRLVDRAERDVLEGLPEELGMYDVFRHLHPRALGHTWREKRLDHVFASEDLQPQRFRTRREWRREGLSDHAALDTLLRMG